MRGRFSVALTPHVVKKGKKCVNKNESLFHVVVGPISSDHYFICVSLSHVIADGYTFYKLYAMLSEDCRPAALEVLRQVKGGEVVNQRNKDVNDLFHSAGVICNILGNMICGTKAVINVQELNLQHLQHLKDSHHSSSAPTAFISTNDIVTSAYLTASGCDVGMMAINYRNRVEGVTRTHAGTVILNIHLCDNVCRQL